MNRVDIQKTRQKAIAALRAFFQKEGFLEVETPIMVNYPGMEPNLDPVKVVVQQEGEPSEKFLITSPEYGMKKLLAEGLEKIWQLNSVFRDREEKSPFHNLEFKMLEYYQLGINYH
ncbi:elongation factor P--(R)-beta-lysine ligase, partial [Patescibacteria group bacterium]|nr:elongation factor P--(R)-beta-lysine ligase [Patescibacteria group bacterium]